jgi:PadR family transcriptional regulator, regulatory protein PadR
LTEARGAITIVDIDTRISIERTHALNREVLLSFWKVHILHHAGEAALHGQWLLNELRRHGYDISPGTLYPLLKRMERLGWLTGKVAASGGQRARKDYRLTAEGRKVLSLMRESLQELYEEVCSEKRRHTDQRR